MARKILVAEALDERDLLAKKISDKIGKISFVDVIRPNEENVFNLRQEKGKYIAKVKSGYQQLQDMITLFQKRDEAILVSNANTVIRTEIGEMTVASAILLRSRMKETEKLSDTGKKDFEMQFLDELEQQGKVFVIAPETTLGVGRTESDPKKLRELYEEGYRIGREKMKKLRKYLECQDL